MSLRTVLVVALALVFGVSAAVAVSQFSQSPNGPGAAATVPVIVASGDIVRSVPLTAEQLQVREVPKDLAPKGALTRVEDAVGRVALYPLAKHQIILGHQLAKAGSGRGVTSAIPKGMRAFNIQNTKVSGAASGFLQPGDKVDVLAVNQNANRSPGGATAVTLLSKIEVLAVDQSITPSAEDAKVNLKELRSVTLLVTPVQAEQLTQAQTNGSLQVTLRNPEDEKAEPNKTTPAGDLSRLPPASIRTLRGSQEGTVILQASPEIYAKR